MQHSCQAPKAAYLLDLGCSAIVLNRNLKGRKQTEKRFLRAFLQCFAWKQADRWKKTGKKICRSHRTPEGQLRLGRLRVFPGLFLSVDSRRADFQKTGRLGNIAIALGDRRLDGLFLENPKRLAFLCAEIPEPKTE